jgi:hypothetical protein
LTKEITEDNGTVRQLTIEDLSLYQKLAAGTVLQDDTSCDSKFMLGVMPRIGAAIREKMPWVPEAETIYLVMDNAGGHGTIEAIEQYTRDLLEQYNIEIIHQVARSPEANVLDLGLWRSIQSWVEEKHKNKATLVDALAASVIEAWHHLPGETNFNVFGKVPQVLWIIIEDDGRNNRVEERRGHCCRCQEAAAAREQN